MTNTDHPSKTQGIPGITSIRLFFRNRKHPWRRIWASFLLTTGLANFVRIRMNGYRIRLSDSQLAINAFVNRSTRIHDERFLNAVLKPGDTYVDVGANIGTLVLTAASILQDTGSCIGVEAHPQTFRQLQRNVALNSFSNIELICSAVGNASGSLTFSDSRYDDVNKVLRTVEEGIKVPVQRLDSLLAGYPHINLLKIDVEGYEKMVLEGAVETLKKTSVVYFESWDAHFAEFGYHTGDVIALFHANGFECFRIAEAELYAVRSDYRSTKVENLIALKDPQTFTSETGIRVHITIPEEPSPAAFNQDVVMQPKEG